MAREIDRRAARTRKALHRALMSLIIRQGYEATTIQNIIDEADVGRSTFYGHYSDKEDLLRIGFQILRGELAEAQRRAAVKDGGSQPLAFSLTMFEHASGYTDVYRALVGGRGGAVAVGEIRQILSEFVRNDPSAAREPTAISRELAVQFIVGAFLSVLVGAFLIVLTWWLERRPRLTPTEVDVMFRRLVLHGLGPSTPIK